MTTRPMGATSRSTYSSPSHSGPYHRSSSTHHSPNVSSSSYRQHRVAPAAHDDSSSATSNNGQCYSPSEPHAMVGYNGKVQPRDYSSPLRPRKLLGSEGSQSSSSLPPPPSSSIAARNHPQHQRRNSSSPYFDREPAARESRNGGGVLQFVPALEEASRRTASSASGVAATNRRSPHHARARSLDESSPPAVSTSWDDLVRLGNEDDERDATATTPLSQLRGARTQQRRSRIASSASAVDAPSQSSASCIPRKAAWASGSSASSHSSKAKSSSSGAKPPVGPAHDDNNDEAEDDLIKRPKQQGGGGGSGGRISSRIASLFGSRALVKTGEQATTPTHNASPTAASATVQAPTPPSPSYSSSSSGYVGWPGTQDKRGATVTVPTSSYEESSVGVVSARSVASSSLVMMQPQQVQLPAAMPTSSRRAHEKELQAAAEREMGRGWDPAFKSQPASSSPPLRTSLSSMRYAKKGHSPGVSNTRSHNGIVDRNQTDSVSQDASLSFHNLFSSGDASFTLNNDTWDVASNPSTGYSKTSSAYFPAEDVNTQLSFPDLTVTRENSTSYDAFPPYANQNGSARSERVARHRPASPALPTAENLAANDRISPPHRTFVGAAGYRGLMEKTKEVPSLMDAVDSESNASSMSKAPSTAPSSVVPSGSHIIRNFRSSDRSVVESDVFDGISLSKESDVFDNLSNFDARSSASPRKPATAARSRASYPERIAEEGDEEHGDDLKLVVLPGGLATIQTTHSGFSNRKTASDYDENLTNSDVDQYGFAKTPGFHEMLSAGTSRDSSLLGIGGNIGKKPRRRGVELEEVTTSESGSSLFSDPYRFDEDHRSIDGDLSEYYVSAASMKKVLRMYRKMSDCINEDITLEEFEREEDEHKAFALFEMRSRIMEKDIERGLERRGGTTPIDDLVMTPYHRSMYRIRDAVIVSKAWRDGASPKDVVNSALLTRRSERTYYVKRSGRPNSSMLSDNSSMISSTSVLSQRSYWWEPVSWLDDTDFMLYRCPSLGPRSMRGSEMFTIGDCQSMLLKLTNEQCINLRRELNRATQRQIEAELLLSDDRDVGDSMMTEAEMTYLGAMEEVKVISKKLVCAEQAFALVKDRIQRLVARYEHFLSKIDTESFAGGASSSVVTYESSYYSEVESDVWEEREKAIWARRAQRAEVKAELAAREALMAKQEVLMIQAEKQRELEALQQKLLELQSESSFHGAVDREHSSTLAKSIAMHRHDEPSYRPQQQQQQRNGSGGEGRGNPEKQKIDDVKKRFRDRVAARKQASHSHTAVTSPAAVAPPAYFPSSGTTGVFGELSASNHRSSLPSHQASAPSFSPPSSTKAGSPPSLFRSAGEEMYQQLDFYERSLRAVERDERYAP